MTVTVARENITAELLDELAPLLRAACAEVHGKPLQLDAQAYLSAGADGRYGLWVVRDDDDVGRPCGLCGMFVSAHPHLSCLFASQDLLYLSPTHRKGSAGTQLLQQVDRELLDIGAVIVYRAAPAGTSLGLLYERAGYCLSETTFERELA